MRFVRLASLSLVAAAVAGACGGSDDEKITAAKLAEGCVLNSDCTDPLVCTFQRCHQACKKDKDCPRAERCVKAPDGTGVCQLPIETVCKTSGDCHGDQVCGVDKECRDGCSSASDCFVGQICATSLQCASSDPTKDSVDSGGNILGQGGAPSGEGGAPNGEGGAPSTAQGGKGGVSGFGGGGHGGVGNEAGMNAGGAASGAGGEGGSAPISSGGTSSGGRNGGGGVTASGGALASGGTLGSGGNVAGGAGAGGEGGGSSPFDYVEGSDGVEAVNNNDRTHPMPVPNSASIYLPSADDDWFSVVAPADGRAHIVTFHFNQTTGLRTQIDIVAGADFSPIGSQLLTSGVSASIYASVGPGTTTLFRMFGFGSTTGRAEFTYEMTAEKDDSEPNQDCATAKPIALNTDVRAQMVIPYISDADRNPDDWFKVELAAVPTTLNLLSVPNNGRFTITRTNSTGSVTGIATTTSGQFGPFTFTPQAGTYCIRFTSFGGSFPVAGQGAIPSNMSEQYVFQVQQ